MKFKFDQIAINSTAKKKPEPKDAANYVGLEHLTPGTFEISEWGSSVPPVGEKLLMKKGDVLFGRRRAYQRKVGIAPFDGIFSVALGAYCRGCQQLGDLIGRNCQRN